MKYPLLGFDPENFASLYNVNRNFVERANFLAFAISVAGKQSTSTAMAMERFLTKAKTHGFYTAFAFAQNVANCHGYAALDAMLKFCGFGCFTSRAKSFLDMYSRMLVPYSMQAFGLQYCKATDLEECYGIGFKTSRFYLLYNRPNVQHAALDTHVWKSVRAAYPNAPKNIPSSKKRYEYWEWMFLVLLKKIEPNMTTAEWDFHHWSMNR